MSHVAVLGILILLTNFIYEIWIPILNTCDIVDAYYGCVGVIAAFIFLMLTKGFGLKLKE